MFDSIVESVMNEIDASVAYTNYYSSIPKEDFDRIINAYGGKYDKIMQFIMDSVRDGDSTVEEAIELASAYKNTDNNVRIAVSNKFKNNEYAFPIQMLQDIQLIQKNGVMTEKKFYTEGFIEVYNKNGIIITLTATYAANHHFFASKTTWCTASDRNGKHDGWKQFMNYTTQYTPDSYYPEIKASLIQVEIPQKNLLYQIQLYKNGEPGLCCDANDKECSYESIINLLTPEAAKAITDFAKLFVDITEKYFKNEYDYQQQRDDHIKIIKAKKEEKIKRRRAISSKLAYDANTEKIELVKSSWDRLLKSNLLKNPDFLNKIWMNSDNLLELVTYDGHNNYTKIMADINKSEALLQQMSYAYSTSYDDMFYLSENSGGYAVMRIFPVVGKIKAPCTVDDGSDVVVGDKFCLEFVEPFKNEAERMDTNRGIFNMVCVLVKTDTSDKVESVVGILKNFNVEGKNLYIKPLRFLNNWEFKDEKFSSYCMFVCGNESIFYDAKRLKKIVLPNARIEYASMPRPASFDGQTPENLIMFDDSDNNVYLIDYVKFELIGKFNRLQAENFSTSFVLSDEKTNQLYIYSSVRGIFYKTNAQCSLRNQFVQHINFMESTISDNTVVTFSVYEDGKDFMIKLPEGDYLIRNCKIQKFTSAAYKKCKVQTVFGEFLYDVDDNLFYKNDPRLGIYDKNTNEFTPQQISKAGML